MQMNRATDYAVRVMIHRATLPSGSKAQLISLVHATGVRGSFLSNVMQRFVHAGFRRGRP
jgi:DNA-binding IscR family transcriptional regulator